MPVGMIYQAAGLVFIGLLTFASALVGVAEPMQAPSPGAVPTMYVPSPFPSNIATPSPLFADKAYFYRGVPNDPSAHPVPPEVQSGFKRERIYCLDWSRMLRTSHRDDWSYFVTTCQCYPEFIFDALPRSTPRP